MGRLLRVDYGSSLTRARLLESCRSRTSLTGHNRKLRSAPQSGRTTDAIDPSWPFAVGVVITRQLTRFEKGERVDALNGVIILTGIAGDPRPTSCLPGVRPTGVVVL